MFWTALRQLQYILISHNTQSSINKSASVSRKLKTTIDNVCVKVKDKVTYYETVIVTISDHYEQCIFFNIVKSAHYNFSTRPIAEFGMFEFKRISGNINWQKIYNFKDLEYTATFICKKIKCSANASLPLKKKQLLSQNTGNGLIRAH